MFTFHAVREKDLPKLGSLYGQLTGTVPDPEKLRDGFAKLAKRPDVLLAGVYDEKDQLIGSGQLTCCPDLTDDTRNYYSMENFVVDEAQRGKGVGTFLLTCLEDYVRQNGGRYINLTSSSYRVQAHHFYEKNGFPADMVKGFKKNL